MADTIYWTNYNDAIRRAPLAGGGTPDILYDSTHGVFYPTGLAIDPAAGRIYWGDSAFATISGAPLAGGAAGGTVTTLYTSADGVVGPTGVAIDPAAGRIYWGNWFYPATGMIRGAPLAGRAAGGTVNTLYDSGQGVSYPLGLAIDPNPAAPAPERLAPADTERFSIGRWFRDLLFPSSSPPAQIYWANGVTMTMAGQAPNPNNNMIRHAPLAGGGTVDTLYDSMQGVSLPTALGVLRAPLGTAAPTISWTFVLDEGPFGDFHFGGGHSGPLNQRLHCSPGRWAADLLGSFLYRAPQSFAYQWRLNGTDIGGATSADYTAGASGTYTCRVTATNPAGSTSQTSAAFTVS